MLTSRISSLYQILGITAPFPENLQIHFIFNSMMQYSDFDTDLADWNMYIFRSDNTCKSYSRKNMSGVYTQMQAIILARSASFICWIEFESMYICIYVCIYNLYM